MLTPIARHLGAGNADTDRVNCHSHALGVTERVVELILGGGVLAICQDHHGPPSADTGELEETHDHRIIKGSRAIRVEREQGMFDSREIGGETSE
jgi:hypothetical protein